MIPEGRKTGGSLGKIWRSSLVVSIFNTLVCRNIRLLQRRLLQPRLVTKASHDFGSPSSPAPVSASQPQLPSTSNEMIRLSTTVPQCQCRSYRRRRIRGSRSPYSHNIPRPMARPCEPESRRGGPAASCDDPLTAVTPTQELYDFQ